MRFILTPSRYIAEFNNSDSKSTTGSSLWRTVFFYVAYPVKLTTLTGPMYSRMTRCPFLIEGGERLELDIHPESSSFAPLYFRSA